MERISRGNHASHTIFTLSRLGVTFTVHFLHSLRNGMKKANPVSRSGRFESGPAAEVAAFSESISFDWRLWEHDILGSLAHATMLQKVGLLTKTELRDITEALQA